MTIDIEKVKTGLAITGGAIPNELLGTCRQNPSR